MTVTAIAQPMNASILDQDINHLLNALEQVNVQEAPYQHFLISDLFDSQLVDDVLEIPFVPLELNYEAGSREEFNNVRRYFNPEVIETFPAAERMAELFLSPEIIGKIEEMGNVILKDSLLRIEYAIDTDKFWLKPHSDLGVKLVTILIYLSKDADAQGWGTDIFYDAERFHSTVPYESNTALMFIPADDTWHGFNPRTISGVRKTLIINYVTPEWRNRQELVHPTEFVY